MNVDVLRRCFYAADGDDDGDGEGGIVRRHREGLDRELSGGKLFVRGRTSDGRALYVIRTHRFASGGFDPRWYLKYNMYTLERALACTERDTDGALEKIVVALDFGQNSGRVRPPLGLAKDLLLCLRDHYPERVQVVLLVSCVFGFGRENLRMTIGVDPLVHECYPPPPPPPLSPEDAILFRDRYLSSIFRPRTWERTHVGEWGRGYNIFTHISDLVLKTLSSSPPPPLSRAARK